MTLFEETFIIESKRCTSMQLNIENDSIIIVRDAYKSSFIRIFRSQDMLINAKVMGLEEFKSRYTFKYNKETCFYVHKKYGVIREVAEVYIKNLYYIDAESGVEKFEFLHSLKDDLINRGLLEFDPLFVESLKGKTIYLYDLDDIDAYYTNLFTELEAYSKVLRIDKQIDTKTKKPLYELKTREEEVSFIAQSIRELLDKGIQLNKIFLANTNEKYESLINRIFSYFGIPFESPFKRTLSSTKLIHEFKDLYSNDMEESLKSLEEKVHTKRDEQIYRTIINTLNEYSWAEDYESVREFVFDDMDNKTIPSEHIKNAVHTIDFLNEEVVPDEYVFLMDFTEGSFPNMLKDEDYLSDREKRILNISDSVDLNKKIKNRVKALISTTKNLVVTHSKTGESGELYLSSAYDEDLFEKCEYVPNYTYSDEFNRWNLLKLEDEYRKFGTKNREYEVLSSHYRDEPYLTYDNTFKGIDRETLEKFLDGKLTLSYSSMNNYYLCGFRYYIENILKLDEFDNTFEISVGNIFHNSLAKVLSNPNSFEEIWNNSVEQEGLEKSAKTEFFLKILKEELKFIIDCIHEQMEYTSLKNALYEEKITVPLSDDAKIQFKGFIDKILYDETAEGRIATIIDYKTGNPEFKLDYANFGLDMQLPIYAYLLSHVKGFENAKIGGLYLQKILSNTDSLEEKKNALKLQGYSNSNEDILKHVDNTYKNSKLIKSMKVSSTGFYKYTKVLSDREIDELKGIVLEKIKNAATRIMDAEFKIDPKEIDGKMYGCKYCRFKDICFMKNKDIVKIKTKDQTERGGEEDANVD